MEIYKKLNEFECWNLVVFLLNVWTCVKTLSVYTAFIFWNFVHERTFITICEKCLMFKNWLTVFFLNCTLFVSILIYMWNKLQKEIYSKYKVANRIFGWSKTTILFEPKKVENISLFSCEQNIWKTETRGTVRSKRFDKNIQNYNRCFGQCWRTILL